MFFETVPAAPAPSGAGALIHHDTFIVLAITSV
jgi:hypothetical protein